MSEKTYNQTVRLSKLADELEAAGLQDVTVQGVQDKDTRLSEFAIVQFTGDVLVVDSVVAAHDPNIPSEAETETKEDNDAQTDFLANYDDMISDLQNIETRLTDSKAKVDAAILEGQTTPPANVNQVWQKTRTALQELSDTQQQAIRLTRVTRRGIKAQRADSH